MHTRFLEAGWTEAQLDHCRMLAAIREFGGWDELMEEIRTAKDRAEKATARRVSGRLLRRAGIVDIQARHRRCAAPNRSA
jgi:hypothetical protein